MSLITPDELPKWLPGKLTVDSASQGWDGLRIRGYEYSPSDVPIPPMQDYLVVVYRGGSTDMNRRASGPWRNADVGPGVISLLTNAAAAHWHWSEQIEVNHIYLSPQKLDEVASDVFEREIKGVELRDILCAEDQVVGRVLHELLSEIAMGGVGQKLYAEALTTQLCVHVLRNYAGELTAAARVGRGLSTTEAERIRDYIEDNLTINITLKDIAAVANRSVYYLVRQFNETFGCPPHVYLIKRRLEKARDLIQSDKMPLKLIASSCGFADQSHMTRLFRRSFSTTPGQMRRAHSRFK